MEKTLQSAITESKKGNLENWIHFFLTTGYNSNTQLSDGIKKEKRCFIGPVKTKLSNFKRVCGPEEEMLYKVDSDYFNHKVNTMMKLIIEGWDLPPLIIELKEDGFFLNDGNHRFEALNRLNIDEHYVILWSSIRHTDKLNKIYEEISNGK